MESNAIFSPDRIYRYALTRYWKKSKPYAMFICLNPSTANETEDDPTVRRCIRYSIDWGYGGFVMTNLFGLRATDPKKMLAHPEPIGPDNDKWIKTLGDGAGIIVAGWGAMGNHLNRDQEIKELLDNQLNYLALTKKGLPRHPLYLKKSLRPVLWK